MRRRWLSVVAALGTIAACNEIAGIKLPFTPCGNGIIDEDEDCDDGDLDATDDCTTECKAAQCGDGFVHAGVEECDDGNFDATDDCTNECKFAVCGDGFVHAGTEECDDGNLHAADECTTECKLAICGDGFVRAGVEECDDGNDDPSDGCLPNCTMVPFCNAYCADIQAHCTADLSQYSDEPICLGICSHFDPGNAGDVQGDTLACREYHVGDPALSAPSMHCAHAGPLGGGVCGTSECEAFCRLAVAVCGSQASPPYPDGGACNMACAAFPGTDVVPYNVTVTSGNSLACRMYHLTVAASSDANANTHCPHIAVTSTGVCE